MERSFYEIKIKQPELVPLNLNPKIQMKPNPKNLLLSLFLGFTSLLMAINQPPISYSQTVFNRFTNLWNKAPQEKAYLQTDKPYYIAGEDIWFKGYVVNATTHQENTQSKFLYVELIDKADSVFHRVKIRRDSLGFAGCLKLKPEMPSGYYAIRAYTYWMQNVGTDFFFSKNIYIGNPIDDKVTSQITYGKPLNGKVSVTMTFTNASRSPLVGHNIVVAQNWKNAPKRKLKQLTNYNGKITFQIPVDSTSHLSQSLDVSINDESLKYTTKFYLPEFSKDFDVQFFPESGVLLNNITQTVAFKAIGTDGLSVEVTGKIYSNDNREITDFSSVHKGMGKFLIEPQLNETYYAVVKSARGVEKRFSLPHVQKEGVILHLAYYKTKIMYEVSNQTSRPNSSLHLLAHSRGKVYVIQPLNHLAGQIEESVLPEGILSLAVIDSVGNTLCERLTFIQNLDPTIISVESDKKSYGKRELVNLNLKVKSSLGTPVDGKFSISITDGRSVKTDSLGDNILSYFLLSSDLKGHVENPASYFSGDPNASHEKLDLLLLTQGWKRFSTADIVKGIYKQPTYYLEAGQALSGTVKNILNKPVKKSEIIMLSPYKGTIRTTKTDSLGHYLITGIEFPDSTSFVLKAKKKILIGDVEIIPDFDDFPKFSAYMPVSNTETAKPTSDYLQQSKEKYYYEGGIRLINLSEVEVKGQKINDDTDNPIYSGLADAEINAERLQSFPGMSIMNMLSTIAGVQVMGDKISIRGSSGNPTIMIDEIEIEGTEELSYLTTNDVENISVFKGANAAIFGAKGGNGVITITLKKGVVLKTSTPTSLAFIVPLGYQKPIQFYVPKYEVDSVRLSKTPDLRTTIYWNPKLVTDSTGLIHLNFYTADKANNYNIVVEGVTNDGEVCRYVGALRREGF